jgi:hypothetical protein
MSPKSSDAKDIIRKYAQRVIPGDAEEAKKVEKEILRHYKVLRNAQKEFIKEIADSPNPMEVKERLRACIQAFHHPNNPQVAVLNACDHLTPEESLAAAKLIQLPDFPLKQLMNLDIDALKVPAKGWDVTRMATVFMALALISGSTWYKQKYPDASKYLPDAVATGRWAHKGLTNFWNTWLRGGPKSDGPKSPETREEEAAETGEPEED